MRKQKKHLIPINIEIMKLTKNIIIGCTGSVATIKLPQLIEKLQASTEQYNFNIKVIVTNHGKHFINMDDIPSTIEILDDSMEWKLWQKRGDPVLHIDLGKWADLLVIAPLSANTLAKISTGICNNLLLCVVRAWDLKKPLLFCPAMNTRMYDHPITKKQLNELKLWGYHEIPTITKTLMCGETGNGGMADVDVIIKNILSIL